MSVWAIATSSLQDVLQSRVKAATTADVSMRRERRRFVPGAPEVYFHKGIDNSRLVKLDDPRRKHEMRMFTIAMSIIFVLCTVYVWQHFRAIEYGYNIESAKSDRVRLMEQYGTLKLEEAKLKNPERIDTIARKLGLDAPVAGQVLQMDTAPDSNGPVMAKAGITVVSLSQ